MRPSRQRVLVTATEECTRLLDDWDDFLLSPVEASRDHVTRLVLRSLKATQTLSPADICLLYTRFKSSEATALRCGADVKMLQTFTELLDRIIRLNCDSLCLAELVSVYDELLKASLSDPRFRPFRDQLSEALFRRLRGGEELPVHFPVVVFVDSFIEEIDESILNTLSDWASARVNRSRRTSDLPSPDLIDAILAIQSCFDTHKISPPESFTSAVRKLVS